MAELKITAFCGSLRTASWNKKLLLYACDLLREKGCAINFIDLRSLELPLFDEDLEEKIAMPPGGQRLVDAINDADGLVIGNPEYNGGPTGALKNAIDWASRADKNPFMNKSALLVGTSTGHWGSIRSNRVSRLILAHLGANVVPAAVTIPFADKAITPEGKLPDPGHQKLVQIGCTQLVKFASAFKAT